MKSGKINYLEISLGMKVRYRVPNLGNPMQGFIPAMVVDFERTTKGMVTVVTLQSLEDNRSYVTVPNNLFCY